MSELTDEGLTGENPTGHEGVDAIVRRLLAARAVQPAARPLATTQAPSPQALTGLARRASAELLPALADFAGPSLDWTVGRARAGGWDDIRSMLIASPLTRDMRLAAFVAADKDGLAALMGGLFGTATVQDRDPTACELSVFAQLVVRLRDVLDEALDHGPPQDPVEAMRLFRPHDRNPLVLEIEAAREAGAGTMLLVMDGALARPLMPDEPPQPAGRHARHLPIRAEVRLAGPTLSLAALARLTPGDTLRARPDATLVAGGRQIACGTIDTDERAFRASREEVTT